MKAKDFEPVCLISDRLLYPMQTIMKKAETINLGSKAQKWLQQAAKECKTQLRSVTHHSFPYFTG